MQTNQESLLPPTPEEIIRQLGIQKFLPDEEQFEKESDFKKVKGEFKEIEDSIFSALKKMIEEPMNYRYQIKEATNFLSVLWKKYDCHNIVKVFDSFMKVEPVFVEMKKDEGLGIGHRDHSVHTFHVFTFGLLFISKLIENIGDDRAQETLKVKQENIKQYIPSFRDYTYQERLFYLWSLISTFHDIAIPLERLNIIREGLNRYSGQFGLEIVGPILRRDIIFAGVDNYFELLSKIFQGELCLDEEGLCYEVKEENPYVKNILAQKFDDNDHGVFGGFLMYKTMKETFLLGKSKKHAFTDMKYVNNYVKYVLSQDIARASLAISLHNLERTEKINEHNEKVHLFLPLSFDKYPLSVILILSDCIQEYLRWEGSSIHGGTKLSLLPTLNLEIDDSNRLKLEVTYFLLSQSLQEELFIRLMTAKAHQLSYTAPKSVIDAANILCKALSEELSKKILLNEHFILMLKVIQDDQEILMRKVG